MFDKLRSEDGLNKIMQRAAEQMERAEKETRERETDDLDAEIRVAIDMAERSAAIMTQLAADLRAHRVQIYESNKGDTIAAAIAKVKP